MEGLPCFLPLQHGSLRHGAALGNRSRISGHCSRAGDGSHHTIPKAGRAWIQFQGHPPGKKPLKPGKTHRHGQDQALQAFNKTTPHKSGISVSFEVFLLAVNFSSLFFPNTALHPPGKAVWTQESWWPQPVEPLLTTGCYELKQYSKQLITVFLY